MAEPLAFLLPLDGFQTSSRCWHAFDSSDNDNLCDYSPRLSNNDLHSAYGCGAAAKMAFTPFLNCDILRTPVATTTEYRAPQEATLAVASPSEAEVKTREDTRAAGENEKTSTSSAVVEKTSGADDATLLQPAGDSRPAGNEEASTSYHPNEVSRRHPEENIPVASPPPARYPMSRHTQFFLFC